MRLLNSCPRLTHLSLTGVAAFQREDFQAYCRQAPAGEYFLFFFCSSFRYAFRIPETAISRVQI